MTLEVVNRPLETDSMCQRFVGLVRVSTEKQGDSRLGLEAGLADINAYVASKGAELVTVLEEVESGTHDDLIDRPTLLKALTLCKRRNACLLVPKVDRLVRSTCVHADIKRSGIPFRAVDNPEANELTLDILVAVAAQEGRQISDRTKKALAAYKARGGKLGSHLVGCHLTDEDRAKGREKGNAKQVRLALEVYEDLIPRMTSMWNTGSSLRKIAQALNDDGETTRQGKPWNQFQVKATLNRAGVSTSRPKVDAVSTSRPKVDAAAANARHAEATAEFKQALADAGYTI